MKKFVFFVLILLFKPFYAFADLKKSDDYIISLASKYVRHEVDINDINSIYPGFLSKLLVTETFSAGRQLIPSAFYNAIEDDLRIGRRGAIRLVLLLSCAGRPSQGNCREDYGHDRAAYRIESTDEKDPTSNPKQAESDGALLELWSTEVFLQSFLRANDLDSINKVHFLTLLENQSLKIPPSSSAYEYAILELSKISFFKLGDEDSQSLSVRRWKIIRGFLAGLATEPDKIPLGIKILGEEYTKDEYRDLRGLESFIQSIAIRPASQNATSQYLVLNDILRREMLNWPFSFSRAELSRSLNNLVSGCIASEDDCAAIRAIHSNFLATDALAIQDRTKSAELLRRSLNELNRSAEKNHPLARLFAEILPALHEIGAARVRGDKATVAKASTPVRKKINEAIANPALAPFLTELGFFELIFINDDYSIGLTEKALSDGRALLERISNSKHQDYYKSRTNDLLTSVRAFLARADDGKVTDQVAYPQTPDERKLMAWRMSHTLIDRMRHFNEDLIDNNFIAAEASLVRLREQYSTLVRNGDLVSSFSFESFLQLRSRLVSEKRIGANSETINRTIIEGDIHLVVTSIVGDLFSAEARIADQKAWAINFEKLSPRISVFFSKLYINSVHQNLNNLDVRLGVNSHNYIKERSEFIRSFASQMIASGDFGQAFNALSIIEDIDHREFLGIARLDSQRKFLVFDQEESNLLDFMERKTTELSILVREVLSGGQGFNTNSLVNKVNSIERELVLRFRTFSNLPKDIRAPLKKARSDSKKRARLAIIAHEGYVEIFGQYGSRTSVKRLGLNQQELRARAFKAYSSFSRQTSDATMSPPVRVEELEQPISIVLDELGLQGGVPVYITADDALALLPAHAFVSEEKRFRHTFLRGVHVSRPATTSTAFRGTRAFFGITKSHGGLPALPGVVDEELGFRKGYSTSKYKVESFLDHRYTKEAFNRAVLSSAVIIHVASHFILESDSLGSNRIMLGDGSFLSLSELFNKPLDLSGIKLLTLAACQTGTSNQVGIEGFRAFKGVGTEFVRAGVGEVVASLWRVSDRSTANFFRVFYHLTGVKGLSPADALRNTQKLISGQKDLDSSERSVLRESLGPSYEKILDGTSHPFHWAGFVLFSQID